MRISLLFFSPLIFSCADAALDGAPIGTLERDEAFARFLSKVIVDDGEGMDGADTGLDPYDAGRADDPGALTMSEGTGGTADMGGVDSASGESTDQMCQVVSPSVSSWLQVPPHKLGRGASDPWDQGSVGACHYVSLINGNISSGANDTGGQFEKKVRRCLRRAGISDADLYDGVVPGGSESTAIQECKAEAMAEQGTPVEFDDIDLDEFWLWDTDLVDYCDDIKAELDANGSATISMSNSTGGHRMEITGIKCTDSNGDGDTDEAHLEIRDPNDPNAGPYSVTVGASDKVTANPDNHFFTTVGTQVTWVTIESRL